MKIYLSKINESWIIDRVREEWYLHNHSISTEKIKESDIIWIIAPWIWKKIPKRHLKNKKVICSYYHFDFTKFGDKEKENFYNLDQYVDEYHVISELTKEQLSKLTTKKITSFPFWVNQNIWFEINNKEELRKSLNLSTDDYLIGSFQRDTEGHDLVSPKLSKGPDVFVDIVKSIYGRNKKLKVILAGKRRNYVINKLNEAGISYNYFEMAPTDVVNKLYNILDLYLVTSRVEGGPQAIMECALTKTPILSTRVGVAPEVLHPDSIYNVDDFDKAKANIDFAYNQVQKYTIPKGFNSFIELFKSVKIES
tara:strand:+ start:23 stop:949 length:927 start_codon:yes stop_codon:yes gene_type:complete